MLRFYLFLGAFLIGTSALGAVSPKLTPEQLCQRQVAAAEQTPDPAVYEACGFGDEKRAWEVWAPFASAYNLKRAIFELCQRYPDHQYGPLYCDKAIELGFGPALMQRGDRAYDRGQPEAALADYTLAIKSGDLTVEETQRLTEKLGLMYLTTTGPTYDPQSGIALLTRAANERSAVANNALGYLVFAGEHGLKKNPVQALDYFWRAILLGCPAAEENLGVFHLTRQGKIAADEAIFYMSQQAFTCRPFDKTDDSAVLTECKCQDILEQEQYFQSQPYLFLDLIGDDRVSLQTKDGAVHTISVGEALPDGAVLQQVRPTLLTLTLNGQRILINRYHTSACVNKCLAYAERHQQRQPIRIRPYHLSFTPQECETLLYYAQKLMNTDLPYVGKKECHGGMLDEAAQLLLKPTK